ncbi:transcription antitermination factor NusG [Lewinella marina]|uniref:transcription termination/antitermination NusG family protein n=1 Tax=Neolewinella marina TaxID=438751 RepID=UPI00142F3EB7|nr:transcription termination/antitermination NusG family protein [Neolewinella marina]NJB86691.1 transcription antitermination factor NusG [Neolewinella marina]
MLITAHSQSFPSDHSAALDDLHPAEPRWFAVRVGHRKEKVVAKQLELEGVEYFLPLRERPFRYKSKTGVRQIPLIGGYLFVKIVARQAVAVQRQNFVFGFVKLGRERRQVKPHEIELLKRLSTDNTLEWVVEEKIEALSPGALVEICRGPLAGVRGHYLNAKNKKTFIISFGGLDARLMTCEVSPRDVVPLEGASLPAETADGEGKKKLW